MINETITELTFERVTEVTTNPAMLIVIISIWLIPLVLMVLLGSIIRAKSPSGKTSSKPMIAYPNFWWIFIIYFFIQPLLILLGFIFPIWIKGI